MSYILGGYFLSHPSTLGNQISSDPSVVGFRSCLKLVKCCIAGKPYFTCNYRHRRLVHWTNMRDSTDMDVDVDAAPQRQQCQISEERLTEMFQIQQRELRQIVQVELDQLIHRPAETASNEKPPMASSLLSNILSRVSGNSQENIEQLLQLNKSLHQKNQSIRQENQSLEREIHKTEDQNGSLTAQINSTKRDLSREKAKNEELAQRIAKLRQMLIPPTEDQVSDSEVQSRFTALRALIFRFVKGTWAKKFKHNVDERTLLEPQSRFFRPFIGINANWKILHNHLRNLVFYIIDSNILGVPHYALHQGSRHLDQLLEEVETCMWNNLPEANRGLVMDWRIATMKATEDFRDNQHSLSHNTQRRIWDFISILETNSPEAEEKGKQMLKQICNDAYDLSLMMRKAKDQIYVNSLSASHGRHLSEYESMVDEEASEAAGSTKEPQTIAYIVAGALVKHPRENPTETKVLEKAQSVVYD